MVCLENERNTCCYCDKKINKQCLDCSSQFICSKVCYEKYVKSKFLIGSNTKKNMSGVVNKEVINERTDDIKERSKRISSTNSGYSIFIKEKKKFIHICQMFWCYEHFGKELIRAVELNGNDSNINNKKAYIIKGNSNNQNGIKIYKQNSIYSNLLRNSSINKNNFHRRNTNLATIGVNCNDCVIL